MTDRADLLSKTTISRLDDSIARIQRTYGRDVLVLTLPSSVVNGTNARDVAHRYAGSLSGVIFLMSDKGLWLFASKGLVCFARGHFVGTECTVALLACL